jgi:hypothetical protein
MHTSHTYLLTLRNMIQQGMFSTQVLIITPVDGRFGGLRLFLIWGLNLDSVAYALREREPYFLVMKIMCQSFFMIGGICL